ncbi:hypothetical protein HU200_049929 [Digitaria exilis]|uniref:F-box domain-containing protein n=1 Tax=Digitaria exilis TaxID=1010633 RepID=A0A835EBM4_9POAL|nr:hypothetical protein HU200_049929 [Digitaria exilis]
MGRHSRRASPLDVDDLLAEILLCLPTLPTSLPCASLVCARWRRLVTDPIFLRRFRACHWEPVGVFHTIFQSGREHLSFSFISDPPPGSILHDRFSVPARCQDAGGGDDVYTWNVRGCRHGRVLLINMPCYDRKVHQFLVWNPLACE